MSDAFVTPAGHTTLHRLKCVVCGQKLVSFDPKLLLCSRCELGPCRRRTL